MTPGTESSPQGFWGYLIAGGFIMWPLLACSIAVWVVALERLWRYRKFGTDLRSFHLEAVNALIQGDVEAAKDLSKRHSGLPSADLLLFALSRREARDPRVSQGWREALHRRRQMVSNDLRSYLWILGTVASAAPFIGLFGTVVGILRSFGDMARTGSGGFTVVAAGISEALIATAAGIIVAVIAVMAYNAFQVQWNRWVLILRLQVEEWADLLEPPQERK
jgi:biopolymer transport protein ExbB